MSTSADPTAADAGTVAGTFDGATPSDPSGAARATIPSIERALSSVLTGADLSNAEALAADSDGIYWVTSDNRLWMLPAWTDTARVVAADPSATAGIVARATLLVRGNDILWSAAVSRPGSEVPGRPLHRTLKTGSDAVLFSDAPSLPAADEADLYYLQGDVDHANLAIAALPLDAHPGAAPAILTAIAPGMDVSALAVDDHNVYWTECAVGSSMFEGTGPIFGGGKVGLLAGEATGFGQLIGLYADLLAPSGDRLYFDFAPTPGSEEVGVVGGVGAALATFPLPAGASFLTLPAGRSLLVFDDWVVSSTAEVPNPPGKMYAASGDGRAAVQIADDVLVPPVAGLPGLVFVDGGGHLLAVSAQDLGAAVAAGQR